MSEFIRRHGVARRCGRSGNSAGVGEILDAEREWHKSELLERTRRLELAVAKLASALDQLQLTLATERGQTRSAIGAESAVTREHAVREVATDLKIQARVCASRRLAQETTELFDLLLRHGTPPEVASSIEPDAAAFAPPRRSDRACGSRWQCLATSVRCYPRSSTG
jgi:hypothetical protein